MTPKNSTSSPNGRQKIQRSNRDSARWIAGLLLLFIGLFSVAAVLFSFFTWTADQSGLLLSDEERLTLNVEPGNLCGWAGARLARLLVDSSFGVFGVLIPVMVLLVGLRVIRQKPLLFNHSILSLCLIMILGSLTLGVAFGMNWSLCCSTGWGGAFGIEIATLLRTHIGVIGTIILLLSGWILTGVFINRNFINTVNIAGNAMKDQGDKIVEIVKQKVVHPRGGGHDELADEELDEALRTAGAATAVSALDREVLQAAAAASQAALRAGVQNSSRTAGASTSESSQGTDWQGSRDIAFERVLPKTDAVAMLDQLENPFLEVDPHAPAPFVDPEPEVAMADSGDGIFTEVDLSQPEGRVVMGRGGMIELDRPIRTTPMVVTDGPFTEITVGEDPAQAFAQTSGVTSAHTSDLSAANTVVNPPAAGLADSGFEVIDPNTPFREFAVSAPTKGVVVTVEANEARLVDEKAISTESYDPLKDLINYRKPPVTLLEDYVSDSEVSDEEIFENKTKIEDTLKNFGIPIQRIKATVGPTVTLYEIVQAQGVKISKIQGLENDIAQSLKALGIRLIAPIPGKGTIGIEVPNRDKQVVSMYSAIRSLRFQESKAELPVVLGRTIQNENYVFDLAKMPHLLVAGATGQGKSVGLNAIITSLLYRKHPSQLKFVMIDPKMVEFSLYAKIERHFLAKMESEEEAIITDPKKAVYTLNSLCIEMDNRLELCKKAGARNIAEYNEKFTSRRLNPLNGHRYLPYIVVVVDEFADLIMTAREVEAPVMRLAQKARAVGIHLIIATQRPDVKVITGGIKANFPARIAFRVMQMIDSRTIIDQPGANQLIGRGDMLFSKDGELIRLQCALVETKEVERIVNYISTQQSYTAPYPLPDYAPDAGGESGLGSEEAAPQRFDALFAEIAREAVSGGQISTSMIQRNYEVGFNRAGRIMMQLERSGIVGRQQGAKPRDILYHDMPSLEAKLQDMGVS